MKSARPAVQCPNCGNRNTTTASFCGGCGRKLDHVGGTRGEGVGRRNAVAAELKQATVIFADIVSSTDLVATLDPEEAMARLRPAVSAMCDAVGCFDGTVLRTMGDGILALFGAPRAREGHALHACRAALAMQARFRGGHGGLSIRVGMHSGEVVFDAGDAMSIQDSAHGLAIHLASRLQALADPGETCLTADSNRLVRAYCETAPLGPRTLRGIPGPVEIFRLVGLRPHVATRHVPGASLTRFRGRAREIDVLRKAFGVVQSGGTRVIAIVGEPGAGKSRLCFEFAEWCRARAVPVYEARAQPYGHATPFQPIIELLRLLLRIGPTDEEAVARQRIADALSGGGPTFEADVALLCRFLGLSPDENPSWLNPKARHARLLALIRSIVGRSGGVGPVVIIEDLHWADEASADFVATLVDAAAGTPMMLVVNHRPSYAPPWASSPHCRRIALGDLEPSDAAALVEELVGGRAELDDLRRRVAERSSGNPFFAEELVRSLAENGALSGTQGDYARGDRPGESLLPVTVQDVVAARIDSLGEAGKSVLQIAAIIGREIPLLFLERLAELPGDELEAILSDLCDAGMIQLRAEGGARGCRFRHPLIQEVAYRSQLKARRSVLHAALARHMEDVHREQFDEFAGLIAYHYEAAGKLIEAATCAARAAKWVGSTNTGQAIREWQRVRLLLESQPRSPKIDSLRIMASAQISWLGWREGLTADQARPFIEEALALARETDDSMVPLLMFVDARLVGASGGPTDAYVSCVKDALSLLDPGRNAGRAAMLHASLSQAYGWAGLFGEALAANDAALAALPSIEVFDHEFLGYSVEHWTVSLRGRILMHLGRFAEAQACFDAMLGIDQALIDPTVLFISHLGYVDLGWCRGDATLAARHAAEIAEIAERHGSPYLRVFSLDCAGAAKAAGGDFAGAARDYAAGLAFMRRSKAALDHEAEILASLAECHARAGDPSLALATAREAIGLAVRLGKRVPELRASVACGAALVAAFGASRQAEAEAAFARAADLVRESGAVIFEPMLRRESGRLTGLAG